MAKGSEIQSSKIATYNFGEKGVVVTKSPVHGEDGELAIAQNATPNPEGGLSGLRKRIGFQALNASAAAGAILAFISCNLEDPGVVAVNPAAFGKWLYSTDGGATWAYLEVQQTASAIPVNYSGIERIAFLHALADTDKTGLIAVDQIAGVNAWAESAVPAAGDDPGRVAYTVPHTIDLNDGYLYYVAADGLSIRRWGYGADVQLVAMPAEVVGIVDWDTDGTDIWALTTYNFNYPTEPYRQQVYKITVSAGTAAKVGTALSLAGGTWGGVTAWNRHYYSLVVINLNATTPTVVCGGYQWVSEPLTGEETQEAHVVKLAGTASDATAPTVILSAYDTKDVPTGHATGTLTATPNLDTPPYEGATPNPSEKIVQFAAGDTVTIGDITYTAVEKANLTTPYTFFRGGVWETGVTYIFYRPSTGPSNSINIGQQVPVTSYTYLSGLAALAAAIQAYGDGYGTGTIANALVTVYSTDRTWLVVRARASGSSGNGIATTETSSIAAWGAATLAGGVYTVTAKTNKVKAHDLINDSTIGAIYVALASNGGHSEIKKIVYPIIAGAWTATWSDVRTQQYPFGYISVWADNNELLFLETPEAIALQLSKGIKQGTTVWYLIGTGVITSADINLIALASGALQRIALP
jgi:hypothetical protein